MAVQWVRWGAWVCAAGASALALAQETPAIGMSSPEADGAWYIDANVVNLAPFNRFTSTVNLVNPGTRPLYIRSSVAALQVEQGERKLLQDVSGDVVRVFPSQLVLRPGQSFTVRLLGVADKLPRDSSSYYVKFVDVSNVHAEELDGGAVVMSTLLGYEVLLNANTENPKTLKADALVLQARSDGAATLTNRSGQHIFLREGRSCPDEKTAFLECTPLANFPIQSMLPGEILRFNGMTKPFLGLLAVPALSEQVAPAALLRVVAHMQPAE